MPTPQKHVDLVAKMVAIVEGLPSVESCHINDYGRHSNFDVWVYKRPTVVNGVLTNGSYRQAISLMKRFCRVNGMIYRGHFVPSPREYHQALKVDIDFIPYDPSSNTFEGVKPEGDLEEMNALQFSLFGR